MTDREPLDATTSATDVAEAAPQSGPPGGLWLWFAAGFLVVFVGMLLLTTTYTMHPSGGSLLTCKLWQYYLIEAQRILRFSHSTGPASGGAGALVSMVLHHLLSSAVGGAITLGVGWGVGRLGAARTA